MGSPAGASSLASLGLSAYATMLSAQGTASADEFQAKKLESSATYGDAHAVEQGKVSVSAAADVATRPQAEQREIVARGEKVTFKPSVYCRLFKFIERSFARQFGGLIRHRMPLHRESMPLLFGGNVGCLFGVFLAPNRLQVIFSR